MTRGNQFVTLVKQKICKIIVIVIIIGVSNAMENEQENVITGSCKRFRQKSNTTKIVFSTTNSNYKLSQNL